MINMALDRVSWLEEGIIGSKAASSLCAFRYWLESKNMHAQIGCKLPALTVDYFSLHDFNSAWRHDIRRPVKKLWSPTKKEKKKKGVPNELDMYLTCMVQLDRAKMEPTWPNVMHQLWNSGWASFDVARAWKLHFNYLKLTWWGPIHNSWEPNVDSVPKFVSWL